MKILLIHQYFKTPEEGGGIRTWYLGKELVANGYEVEIITAHNGPAQKRTIEGMVVHYLSVPYANEMGFWRRMKAFFSFANKATKLAMQLKGYSLVYAVSTPLSVALVARTIKRKLDVPYFFEVGDLWPEAPVQLGWLRNPLLKAAAYRWERAVYLDAKTIIALSPAIAAHIHPIVPEKTILTITNFADTEFFAPSHSQEGLKEKYGLQGRKVISYTGAIGQVNHLEHLLAMAGVLPEVAFLIMGEGARRPAIAEAISRQELTNVHLIAHSGKAAVGEVLALSDAMYLSYGPQPVLETGSPNKYFDALAAGKPILVNFGGWIKEEVEQVGCGLYVPPKNPDLWLPLLRKLLNDPPRLQEMGALARALAEKKYTVKKQFPPLLERLELYKAVRGLA
jgi:glycosyltransferase involved in cell wall biosynthesis